MNRWYQIRRLRGAVFLILVGVLALLNQWNILRWDASWPLFLIVFGLLVLAERAAWTVDVREQREAQAFAASSSGYSSAQPVTTGAVGSSPSSPTGSSAASGSSDPSTPEDPGREGR